VAVANSLGLPSEEFKMYAWFQVYIRQLTQDYELVPDLGVAAQYVGITQAEFEQYLEERCEQQSKEPQIWDDDAPVVVEDR